GPPDPRSRPCRTGRRARHPRGVPPADRTRPRAREGPAPRSERDRRRRQPPGRPGPLAGADRSATSRVLSHDGRARPTAPGCPLSGEIRGQGRGRAHRALRPGPRARGLVPPRWPPAVAGEGRRSHHLLVSGVPTLGRGPTGGPLPECQVSSGAQQSVATIGPVPGWPGLPWYPELVWTTTTCWVSPPMVDPVWVTLLETMTAM